MSEPAIKSQPVYAPLQWDLTATHHLLAVQEAGAQKLLELLRAAPAAPLGVLAVARSPEFAGELKAAFPEARIFESDEALHSHLRECLAAARMGLRLYLAGTDGFIWLAAKLARGFGLAEDEMRLERWGSLERPVYCTHCQRVTPGVRTNPCRCPGCGRMLFVRDHFSRHLAAYMGIQVDAETPGIVPVPEEAFP